MIDTKWLRCTVGKLGALLPIIVLVMSVAYGYGLPDSISATYYVPTCITPFMIILGSAGLLLFSYKGYEKIDDIVCSIAGVFALGICLFPCNYYGGASLVGTFQLPTSVSGILHNISAICFFALLALNSLFLFTKSSGSMTKNKKKRNIIFRVCGIGMMAAFLVLIPANIYGWYGATWAVETIALVFFAVSWLTKANCYSWLFADKGGDVNC